MDEIPANPAADPFFPHFWAIGIQASLLAHPRFADAGLPPNLERDTEELVRFFESCCVASVDCEERIKRLTNRTAGGTWTDADRAELRGLVAENDARQVQVEARRREYLAMLARHGLTSEP